MQLLEYTAADFDKKFEVFFTQAEANPAIVNAVKEILHAVEKEGDDAVARYIEKLDKAKLKQGAFAVEPRLMAAAAQKLGKQEREAIEGAIASVRAFHTKGLPKSWQGKNAHGALVGERYYPLERVGIYIPGSQAPLVSTVVMTATLAKLAGVKEVAAFTPCNAKGEVNEALLAAFHLSGVTEVYRLGGAVAVAAMTFGTKSIKPVVKLFGPGNAYLNEAKRQVFGRVGIDLLAGPSEVLIIADKTANPEYVAADLLAQAEHDPRAQVVLVTPVAKLIPQVLAAIERQRKTLTHKEAIDAVMERNFLIVKTRTLKQCAEVANRCAPEHMELQVAPEEYEMLLENITTAGAVFLGHDTPTVLGDFAAGPNHTLPTARSGRYLSGLRITDFFRRTSITGYDAKSLKKAAPIVRTFSKMEQLDGHGESFEVRRKK